MATINYCNYEIKGTLDTNGAITAGGVITAPGGNSSQWNTGYANSVTGIAFSGTTTKTLTVTQQDGGTLTGTFTDLNYYTTAATFNTGNGIITFSGAGGQPGYTVDLDGRYALASVVSGVTSINFKTDGTALNVASNTITTSGTMTGVWQGTSSQYVNGQGDLITFPSVAGTYTFDLTGDSGTSATVTSGSTVSIIGSSTISTTSNGFNVSVEAITAAVVNGGAELASGDQIYDFVIGQLPSVSNNTITLSAGTGLTGGGNFTLNQSSNETITFNNSITNNNQLTNGAGYITSSSLQGVPAILSNGSTPSLNSGITAAEIRSLIGAGTSSSTGTVTSVTVSGSSGISGSGTVTTSGSIGLTNSDKGSSQNIFKNVLSDSGTAVADNNNDTLSIVGGSNVSTAVVGDVLTITATDTTTNNYVTGASQSGGTLTLTRTGLSTLTATGFTNATNTQTFTNKSGSNSQWTNDEGYITSAGNQGTVTSVATGSGLTGGTITTSGTLSHADTSSQATVNNSGNTYIQDVTLDTFGHVTGLVSSTTTLGGLGFTGATNANYITNNNQISNGEGYTTNTGTTTASNTQTFTNKSGNISQWTNNSGYITSYVDTNNYVTGGNVTSGTVTLTRTGLSNVSFAINNSQITNGMGFTTNTGTTTAGNTQTFTGKSGNISQWTNDSGYSTTTGTVTPSSTDTFTNKSGNISQWTNNSGYVTSSGNTTIGTSTNIGISAGGAVLSTVSLTQGVITAFTTRTMTLANLGYTGATNANYITNNNQLTNGAGYTTNTGTVTSVGLSIDTNDALDVSNTPVTSSGTIALEWQGDGATVVLGSGELADWPPNQQTQFTSNFLDSSSSTSYFYIPFNSTSESTSSQYYNHLACAQNGTVKKIMMMHTSGAASTSFTTQLRVVKNGVTAATSGELTPSNGANDGSYVEYLPSTTFVKGDRIRIGYQKSATSKYWQGVSAIVIFEFTPV
jgi:fibronectin-binding autotransporter adhesin